MKKVIVGVLVLLLAVIFYLSFFSEEAKKPVQVVVKSMQSDIKVEEELELPPLEEVMEENEVLISIATIEKELESENEENLAEEVEPEIVEDAKDIMVETDMEEVEKAFPSKQGIKPEVAISLPQGSISKLNVGDTISLPNMGTGQFDAKITKRNSHKNGSVTVTGNLVDSNNEYAVVLTEGKNMSFGTVTTPNGSYEIETRNGVGYVYATDEIDRAWIDYSQSDVLIPSEDRHNH